VNTKVQPFRRNAGGLIDRSTLVPFHFDGRTYHGHAGDTLASALLANGVRLVGRSFKYHRPRGLLAAGSEEPNALVELRTGARREPNTRATVIELFEGLEARSQNRWPSLQLDLGAVNGLLAPLIGAGFYYKTFMWPAAFWERIYEPLIRRAAGLGRAATAADPDGYEKAWAFCDLLVVGGGETGLRAALAAGRRGERVIVADEDFRFGGRCLAERAAVDGLGGGQWVDQLLQELAALPEVCLLPRTTVFGAYDSGVHGALERVSDHLPAPLPGQPRQRLWRIVAKHTLLACGSIERPLVFGNNDRPGVMLAGAVRTYLNRYGVLPGERAVVFADNDSGETTAADLRAAGVEVAAVLDARQGASVVRALGGNQLRGVEIREGARTRRVDCDLLAMSGGWMPNQALATHTGGKALPDTASRHFEVSKTRGKCFVDFQHDVTVEDLLLARQEGFTAVEHLKRYTTLGMATDQGKTSNLNALAIVADATGKTLAEVGSTRLRPPYTPVALGAFAGHHRGRDFRPSRLTPSHAWAQERGAVFVEAGVWLRAQYFPLPGEADWLTTVTREVQGVRSGVGICDVSTLGKIDLQGPDAVAFLERVYANRFQSLGVGRCRYALMLREDGMVMDDGTVARLGPERFLVTTTTANAVSAYQHWQYCHQVLWPELDVQFVSVTERWAQFSVAGPNARQLLQRVLATPAALENTAFPYLACGSFPLSNGLQAQVYRVSFSGELAYEIAVPAEGGEALLRELFSAGADLGVLPYGTEALGVMRIEKGHVAGNELTGQTTAFDLGLQRLVAPRRDAVGTVLAQRAALLEPSRPQLVGLRPVDHAQRLYAGSHFLPRGVASTAEHDAGYLTSVAYSPSVGHWIGLGLLAHGPKRHGETLRAVDLLRGHDVLVEVCDPVFLDPAGERLRA
jgi:glycine cleavage system aminomethyltransferase T/NADPH-dependent 2,4-dienoyl-CoA reductase/sulfur reductase-like enzyme